MSDFLHLVSDPPEDAPSAPEVQMPTVATDPELSTDTPAAARAASKPKRASSGPKWEEEARNRLRSSLKRLSKPLGDAVQRDANEADTRLFVTELLVEALGFHRFEDLDTEYPVKGQFADYGLRIDKQLVAFVEVKRCATKLAPKHLRQLVTYAVTEGVEWIILTNAALWQLYHLQGGLPVSVDLVLEVDLLGGDSLPVLASSLLPLTRDATKRGALDTLWRRVRASSPQSVAAAIMAPAVVRAVRAEMHRQTGHLLSIDEVAHLIRDTTLRPEVCG